ncbi:unnamed protein product [Urochloa decumbens]|uniref:Protein kinase domain-containing protein n=1 Tax=Urochloa decumbens TaxID=240449 RepID=A0ABC9C376_9POAL
MHHTLVAVLLLQVAATPVAAGAVNIALPECKSKCGDVDIPYPFGIGDDCSRPGFKVNCHRLRSGAPDRLTLGAKDGPQVLEISVVNSTVRIHIPAVKQFSVNTSKKKLIQVVDGKPYAFSEAQNRLVHIGCGFTAQSWSPRRHGARRNCSSSCPADRDMAQLISRSGCDGIGCCNALMPSGVLAKFLSKFQWNNLTSITRNASLVVVEREWWSVKKNVKKLKEELLSGNTEFKVPAILDWSLDNSSSCDKAKQKPDYGCYANSECQSSTSNAKGYVCRCRNGYQGNPYVRDGCQSTTSPNNRSTGTYIAVGFGIGMCLLLVVLVIIYSIKKLKDQRAKKMREYFFKQNRGLLLQQLVDKDIAERMIFSLEELNKATNKFDEARILGGGGHGTVYKGILSNQHVVAIKKSKLVIQREIDGFINEVAILSQINHRNVVRLFGCCLETEVPLLVYEFISNGTLYAHIHVDTPVSLPWKDRLRIASEVASSLAYLHSEASISIVHRDIKTSNILLDDSLIAKVSDFGASRGISIDKSGVTTAIQGTYGYLDPEYFYTRRLTEKSDVYSFGVMLVELLTRKKPTIDISDGVSLVTHFIQLFFEDRLSEILDVQVIREGEEEAKQVATVAALCLQIKADDRPTMRQVETVLQGIQSSDDYFQCNPGVQGMGASNNTTFEGSNAVVHDNNSRRFSTEREMLLSATLPR